MSVSLRSFRHLCCQAFDMGKHDVFESDFEEWLEKRTKELNKISKRTFDEVVALDKEYKKELEK